MIISELRLVSPGKYEPTGRQIEVELESEWPHHDECGKLATAAFGEWDGIGWENGAIRYYK